MNNNNASHGGADLNARRSAASAPEHRGGQVNRQSSVKEQQARTPRFAEWPCAQFEKNGLKIGSSERFKFHAADLARKLRGRVLARP